MIRTQIQLTEIQAASLKRLAERRGCSVAELVREGVEHVIRSAGGPSVAELRAKAIAASGRFHSGLGDVSREHDDYLAEDFSE